MKINQEITTDQQRLDLIKELQNLEIKKGLSKSWEKLKSIGGWYISTTSGVNELDDRQDFDATDQSTFATKEQAESSRAYAMLTQLMKEANGDWVADRDDDTQMKFNIVSNNNKLLKAMYSGLQVFITLKSEAIRDEFLANHEELIKTFYQIK